MTRQSEGRENFTRATNMKHWIENTEKGILWVLAVLLLVAVLQGTVDLAAPVLHEIISPPFIDIAPDTLFHMFGSFLIVLMGLKLIKLTLLSMSEESSAAIKVRQMSF